MPKESKKQKILFRINLRNKKVAITKTKLEWAILVLLVVSIVIAQVSGLYPYLYNQAKCHDAPLEIRGSYYRTPHDDNYGIHVGSDYSHCFGEPPSGLQRDPLSKEGAKLLQASKDQRDFTSGIDGYTVYVPEKHSIMSLYKSGPPNNKETYYRVASGGIEFKVREMKKDSPMSYTGLCSKPPEEKWWGEIIGYDTEGRKICRAHSYYIEDYVVGIDIGNTTVRMKAPLDKSEAELDTLAIALFNTMRPYKE